MCCKKDDTISGCGGRVITEDKAICVEHGKTELDNSITILQVFIHLPLETYISDIFRNFRIQVVVLGLCLAAISQMTNIGLVIVTTMV